MNILIYLPPFFYAVTSLFWVFLVLISYKRFKKFREEQPLFSKFSIIIMFFSLTAAIANILFIYQYMTIEHSDNINWIDLAVLALNTTSAVVVSILFTNPSINEEMQKIASNKNVLYDLIHEKDDFIDTIDEKDDFILLQDVLLNIQKTMLKATDPNTMLDTVCHQFCEYTAFNVAWIGFAKYGDTKLPISFFHDDAEPRFLSNDFISVLDENDPYSNGPSSQAMLTCKSVVIEDTQSDLRFSQWYNRAKFSQIKSVLAFPMYLKEGDRPVGVLTLYSQKTVTSNDEVISLIEDIVYTMTVQMTNLTHKIKQKIQTANSMKRLHILEKIINSVPENIFWKDAQLRYLGANNAFLEYKNISCIEDIYLKTDKELGWESEQSDLSRSEKEVIAKGKNIINHIEEHENRWFKSNRIYLKDQNNTLLGLLGTSTDITYQHNIATELKKNEKLYHTILDKIPDLAIIYFDKDRRILKWSFHNALMFGYTKEMAIGQKIEALLYPEEIRNSFISHVNSWLDINRPIEASVYELKTKESGRIKVHAEYILQDRLGDKPVFIGIYTKI